MASLRLGQHAVQQEKARGLIRQEWTKTDAGYRSIALPKFAVDALMRRKLDATPNKLDLVFPNRNGDIYDPHNFRRTWREARGTNFAWVTPKTSRKSVATLIANEHSAAGPASQLGHADDGATAVSTTSTSHTKRRTSRPFWTDTQAKPCRFRVIGPDYGPQTSEIPLVDGAAWGNRTPDLFITR
ncbi:hypothetical protein [Nocardia sp. R7R-8]|uniref:hypothetical protein n=1 Tax=Nocardia sp. R7R-8 TaxID=3459304 RepID=UPI00403D581F